jgi:hypothetical protein
MSKVSDYFKATFHPKAPPPPGPPSPVIWAGLGIAAGFLIVVLITK